MSAPRVILLPSDDSPSAERARAVAESLAARFGAHLHDLYVAAIFDSGAEYEWPADPGIERPAAMAPSLPGSEHAVRISDSPGRGILTYAREIGADLIVMGTHGRDGLERLVRGSTSEHVVRRAECPVLLVPPDAPDHALSGRVVVAYDFSAQAAVAADAAAELAAALELPLDLLHVVEVTYVASPYGPVTAPVDYEALRRRSARLLGAVAPTLQGARVRPATRVGSAVEEVLEHARVTGAGLIVVGSHGRRGVRRLVLGSVAEGIARRAPCPVLVVPVAASRDSARRYNGDLVAA